MSRPILRVRDVWKRFGERVTASGIDLEIGQGEFFTMLGPSGSGKSTVLRMIAGLEHPDRGRILIDEQDVTDLPPWRRDLGMVFQQYANFPHMTVAQNVAYGLRRREPSREVVRQRVSELLALVSLPGFEERRVTALSGGEQQRVAIARALAPRPRLLLLDEPLSALDEKIRREMQRQMKDIQRATGTTFVYVTHDQEEALTMSDRVAVLNEGRLVQVDEPHLLFRRPRTRFVAEFFRGNSIVTGKIEREGDRNAFVCAAFEVPIAALQEPLANPPAIAIRGEDIRIDAVAALGDTTFDAILRRMTYRGTYTDYELELCDGQMLTASATFGPRIKTGRQVKITLRPDRVTLLQHESVQRT